MIKLGKRLTSGGGWNEVCNVKSGNQERPQEKVKLEHKSEEPHEYLTECSDRGNSHCKGSEMGACP